MIRKNKLYNRPRKAFEKSRIDEENKIKEKYALKSKTEIWKAEAKVDYFRKRAMALTKASEEEKEIFLGKLNALGLNASTLGEVLGLTTEDILKRRLPTIVAKKNLSSTVRQARQFVTHKKVLIDGKIVNSPSYLVPVSQEANITVKVKLPVAKPVVKEESKETEEEITNE